MIHRKLARFVGTALAMSALVLTATGCKGKKGGTTSPSVSNGTLRVLLTDDPVPYRSISSVWITVSRVEAHHTGTGSGWVTMSTTPTTIDALSYRNGVSAILASMSLAPQSYDHIRIAISNVAVDLIDGRTFYPTLSPSLTYPGVDIPISTNVNMVAGMTSDVLVDLDLSGALEVLGDTSSTATITGVNFNDNAFRAVDYNATGSIDGTVASDNGTLNITSDDFALGNVQVTVLQNGYPIASGITDAFGYYKVVGLMPGSYDLRFERAYNVADGGYFEEQVLNNFVVQGYVLSQDAILEEAPSYWP